MKIKLVLDINKTQQAQLNAVVTGRQGDTGVTVNVFVVDSGVPCNLTGQDIYYEGLKPNNAYVRDKTGVKMINATQGNFEYTFRPETFGVAGVGRRSYFSIEQGGTVRASTQDFGLVTLADAMTGNTMSGPYISELEQLIQEAQWLVNDINSRWTAINTKLTQLENKLNTMDVVKRSGDTMTGDLNFDVSSVLKRVSAYEGTKKISALAMTKTGSVFLEDGLRSNFNPWVYDSATQTFTVNANTNLVKKNKDGRADLTLTADATTFDAGYFPVADRRGNTVTLRMAIQRVAGSSNRIITTLPADMRPTVTIVLTVPSTDGTMGKVTITTTGEIWIESSTATSILGKNLYISTSYVTN